jgi:hypothetical protein
VLGGLRSPARGTVVLAIDGLSLDAAERAWTGASVRCLTSTFPSTSVTAWMTALTGTDPSQHLAVGMLYRIPRADRLAHVVANRVVEFEPAAAAAEAATAGAQATRQPAAQPETAPWRDEDVIAPQVTLFERARAGGARCVVLGRDMDKIPGPWTRSLFRGAERAMPSDRQEGMTGEGEIADPARYAAALTAEVEGILAAHDDGAPLLLWAYVNLDDHIHRHGYDAAVHNVLGYLEQAAVAWADRQWRVLAHSDHGQAELRPDARVARVWQQVSSASCCRLPSGGAGRARWLYPKPALETRVRRVLAEQLGDQVVIGSPEELAGWGLWRLTPGLRDRVGEIVAITTAGDFPAAKGHLRFDHGGVSEREMLVPLTIWPARER